MSANRSQTFRDSLIGYAVILAVVLLIGAIIAGGTYWSVIHDVSHDSYGDHIEGNATLEQFLTGFPSVRREQAIQFIELAKESLLASVSS